MIYAHYHNLRKKVPTKPFFANFLCEKKINKKKSLRFFKFYPFLCPHTPSHRFFYEIPVENILNKKLL